jgi:hypothetical protein
MFCTPTGQTGVDAYTYEAAQIANSQRELDERMKRLVATVREEHPELFANSTDFLFANANAAEHFSYYVRGREHEYLYG